MSVDRDSIYEALFQLLKSKLGSSVTTIGRRHMMPPDLTSADQPAVFVVQGPEEKDPKPRGTPGKVTLHGFIIAYCYGPANTDGTTPLNILMKAIEDALVPDPAHPGIGPVQTLGGKVDRCWIEGLTDVDPGIYGQQAVAIMPVHMLVP